MGRPRTITDQALLAGAKAVFLARGAEATVREVAEAVGVSQGVLFQRFGSKVNLFFAALVPTPPSVESLTRDLSDDARSDLVAVAARVAAWLDDAMPGALRAALHPQFPAALSNAHGDAGSGALVEAIQRLLTAHQAEGRVVSSARLAEIARALVACLHGQALIALLAGGSSTAPEVRAERAVAAFWTGLAVTEDER